MIFITTETNENIESIALIRSGTSKQENEIAVGTSFQGNIGDRIDWFNEDWTKIDEITLMKDGKKTIPSGKKLLNDELVEMSQVEKIQANIESIPLGMKILNNQLVAKTLQELFNDGDITGEEYKVRYNAPILQELNELDIKAVRPLRAIITNTATKEDLDTFEKNNIEVETLRNKLL